MSAADMTHTISSLNQTVVPFDAVADREVIYQRFQASAHNHPNRRAVTCPDTGISWTYQEVNERANRLATYIRSKCSGLTEKSVGAVYVKRSAHYVLFIIALAKAGLTYLPIDVSIPVDRLEYILEDSQAVIVLTINKYVDKLSKMGMKGCEMCVYDDVTTSEAIATIEAEDHPVRVTWDHAAYLIYTSGSTGKPKGVLVHHGGAVNLTQHTIRQLKLTEKDVIGQILGAAFDPVTMELWPILSSGGEVVIIDDETKLSGVDKIMDFMVKHKITFGVLPTALADGFIHLTPKEGLVLRVLCCGGDRLHGTTAALPFAFVNCYGPTETSVMCTVYQTHGSTVPETLTPGETYAPQPRAVEPPIGRAVSNAAVYVLDPQGRPVPIGFPGELYVTGAGVAIGYKNKPEQTMKAFLDDDITPKDSAVLRYAFQPPRMYRTGDLVRINPADEQIDFIGRVDFQVKIRGFRIELGEIETVIMAWPGVMECACIVKQDKLLAFIVLLADTVAPSTLELKKFVQTKLPEYMTPSAFVFMSALPMTTNNKVDRQALRAQEVSLESSDQAVPEVAPTNDVEARICKMWIEILGVASVGILDNWFDRGGSSLASTLLLAKMRSTFHMEISLGQFFNSPTVQGLARVVSQQGNLDVADHIDKVLLADAASLEDDIKPCGPLPTTLRSVFLTGATGFLGAYILLDILSNTRMTAYCLVRAKTVEDGRKRIIDNVSKYDPGFQFLLDKPDVASRLIAVTGDLALPQLGIDPTVFDKLCNDVDIIIHNGALVNFSYPYMSMKKANVDGTKVLLRMATTKKAKVFHYVSTLSVLPHGVTAEEFVATEPTGLEGGYTQTKWVAERIVHEAHKRGIPGISISRPGRITGHSRTGATNTDDFLILMMKGCAQMKCAPDMPMPIEINPVDFCARAIVDLSTKRPCDGKIFHLHNPDMIPWSDVLDALAKCTLKYNLRRVPYAAWRKEVMSLTDADHNALMPLVPQFSDHFEAEVNFVETYCVNNSKTLLASSLKYSSVDRANLLQTYVGYLVSVKFLPQPH